jgi:hypothetical protein
MYRGDKSWTCDGVGFIIYVSATWEMTKHTALLHKGTTAPNCATGTCNPINFTVLKPSDWIQGHIIDNQKDDKWPPEQIIQYYGPATWAEDGSWDYRTPIYMLNRIIRLQAVVEITINKATRTLKLLAKQSTKMHNAIYQNCLALDYL